MPEPRVHAVEHAPPVAPLLQPLAASGFDHDAGARVPDQQPAAHDDALLFQQPSEQRRPVGPGFLAVVVLRDRGERGADVLLGHAPGQHGVTVRVRAGGPVREADEVVGGDHGGHLDHRAIVRVPRSPWRRGFVASAAPAP
ncbi:hypothetical protein ABZ345_31330 [Lentzea sp. NPDC005914]|uniref:hypothetical protein n=1 Tax=Lentzea sp. NPDC005914 TaxID=3154572 RepID=UPI0033DE0244